MREEREGQRQQQVEISACHGLRFLSRVKQEGSRAAGRRGSLAWEGARQVLSSGRCAPSSQEVGAVEPTACAPEPDVLLLPAAPPRSSRRGTGGHDPAKGAGAPSAWRVEFLNSANFLQHPDGYVATPQDRGSIFFRGLLDGMFRPEGRALLCVTPSPPRARSPSVGRHGAPSGPRAARAPALQSRFPSRNAVVPIRAIW